MSHKVRLTFLTVLITLLLLSLVSPVAQAQQRQVDVITAKGTINPTLAGYVNRGIKAAHSHGAAAVVIRVDTPGGLDDAMRDIIKAILGSNVPVVVYVSPAGARAASAGTFITVSAHVAAMAPGTAIGAAHPVGGQGEEITGTLGEKVLNDSVAYMKGLAELRGRNVEWLERAVRESASVQAEEAKTLGVVDLIAPDLNSLLQDIDGKKVRLASEREVVLQTRDVRVNYVNMSLLEDFLFTISNPNIAFILLGLAMLGLFFELSNPGAIFPGVLGGISLLLALYSLGTLPVNWAGVLLIALAFALFLAEIFVTSHGVLAGGGVVALFLGGTLLISESAPPALHVDQRLVAGVAAAVGVLFLLVVQAVIRAHRRQTAIGQEALIGRTAITRTPLKPDGYVFLEGERWRATSESGPLQVGEEVVITKVEGLSLLVTKKGGTGA